MANKSVFTIDEIKNYILSQDSLEDVLYNLSAQAIVDANLPKDEGEEGS